MISIYDKFPNVVDPKDILLGDNNEDELAHINGVLLTSANLKNLTSSFSTKWRGLITAIHQFGNHSVIEAERNDLGVDQAGLFTAFYSARDLTYVWNNKERALFFEMFPVHHAAVDALYHASYDPVEVIPEY